MQTKEDIIDLIQKNAYYLEEIKDPTYEQCLTAVKRTGSVLQIVPKDFRIKELCIAAVHQDGWALKFVPKLLQTDELCIVAVKSSGTAIYLVKDQTPEIIEAALEDDTEALQYIKKQTMEMILKAIGKFSEAITYLNENKQTIKVYTAIFKKYYQSVEHLEKPSIEICELAIQINPKSICHIETRFINKTCKKKTYLLETLRTFKFENSVSPEFEQKLNEVEKLRAG
jgi:hypothetical protein